MGGGVTSAGLYEQIKDDLGYLGLSRTSERFATLADDASKHDWTPSKLGRRSRPYRSG
jgi:hypothetical protein